MGLAEGIAGKGFNLPPEFLADVQTTAVGQRPGDKLPPVFTGMSGFFYLAAAVVLGIWFLLAGIKLVRTRTTNQARKLFFTSIGYLPLLLIALVVDRLI